MVDSISATSAIGHDDNGLIGKLTKLLNPNRQDGKIMENGRIINQPDAPNVMQEHGAFMAANINSIWDVQQPLT